VILFFRTVERPIYTELIRASSKIRIAKHIHQISVQKIYYSNIRRPTGC